MKRDADGDIDLAHLIIPIYKPGAGRSQADININDIAAFCLAVPYLRQGDYPPAENYAQGVQTLYRQLFAELRDEGKPVIAMGHLQATGSKYPMMTVPNVPLSAVWRVFRPMLLMRRLFIRLWGIFIVRNECRARECTLFRSSYSYVFLRKRLQKQCGDGGV